MSFRKAVNVRTSTAGLIAALLVVLGLPGAQPAPAQSTVQGPPPPPSPLSRSPARTGVPELPRVFIDTDSVPVGATIIAVKAGGNLQTALNQAATTTGVVTITLEPGTVYQGNFKLPLKVDSAWIVVRPSRDDAMPAKGVRYRPSAGWKSPRIVTPNSNPAMTAANGAHHLWVAGVEITANGFAWNIVSLGDGLAGPNAQTRLEQVPHHLVFDRVYVHGPKDQNTLRGFLVNSAHTAVIDSWISEIHSDSGESQAIGGHNGAGPFKIVNNYLEASTENVMFGGADAAGEAFMPADIEIRGNYFFKPLSWRREHPTWVGRNWFVKNLLELKMARRVLIEGNVLENSWPHAQAGAAVLLTTRNQQGGNPFATVADVTFRRNRIINAAQGFTFLGQDDLRPSVAGVRIHVHDNHLHDVGGFVFFMNRGAGDLVIEHNTHTGIAPFWPHPAVFALAHVAFNETTLPGFVFRNNVTPFSAGGDGILGQGAGGVEALNKHAPGWTYVRNVAYSVAPSARPLIALRPYPQDNAWLTTPAEVGFVDAKAGNYRLGPTSRYKGTATNRRDPGADFDAVDAATAGVTTR